MTKIEKVAQSVFGSGESVTRSVKPVEMPNPYEGVARSLNMGAKMLGSFSNGLADLAAEGHRRIRQQEELTKRADATAFRTAQVNYNAAREGYLVEIQNKYKGASAINAISEYNKWSSQKANEFCANLSPGAQKLFREFAHATDSGVRARLTERAYQEDNKAFNQANNEYMTQAAKAFAATGNKDIYAQFLQAFDAGYFRANGRIVDNDTMSQMEDDYEGGMLSAVVEDAETGKLKVDPKGKKVKVGEENKADAKAYMDSMRAQHKIYTANLRRQRDLMVSMRMQELLKGEDFGAAESFMSEVKKGSWGEVSSNVQELLNSELNKGIKIKVARQRAEEGISAILNVGSADPAAPDYFARLARLADPDYLVYLDDLRKYGGEELDKRYSIRRSELYNRNWGDNIEYRRFAMEELDTRYRLLKEQQKATLVADIAANIKELSKLPEQDRIVKIMKMTDGRLKKELLEANRKQYESWANKTPKGIAYQQTKFGEFINAVHSGKYVWDKREYKLSNENEVAVYVARLGLSTENVKRAFNYFNRDTSKRVDTDMLGSMVPGLPTAVFSKGIVDLGIWGELCDYVEYRLRKEADSDKLRDPKVKKFLYREYIKDFVTKRIKMNATD